MHRTLTGMKLASGSHTHRAMNSPAAACDTPPSVPVALFNVEVEVALPVCCMRCLSCACAAARSTSFAAARVTFSLPWHAYGEATRMYEHACVKAAGGTACAHLPRRT